MITAGALLWLWLLLLLPLLLVAARNARTCQRPLPVASLSLSYQRTAVYDG